jgi:hypothetical protein
MFGSIASPQRKPLWAILSFLFVLGFAVSTTLANSERNKALDSVGIGARDEAQLATAGLAAKDLAGPIEGSQYDKLAAKVWRSVESHGSINGVTLWSARGRILFSLNKSVVGILDGEMQPLIAEVAQGSGDRRVVGGTVQTFVPVTKGSGQVVVVEVDQPSALVDAQIGGLWSALRLVCVLGLVVSLLFLGLPLIAARVLPPATEDTEEDTEKERDARTKEDEAAIQAESVEAETAAEAEAAAAEAAAAAAAEVAAVESHPTESQPAGVETADAFPTWTTADAEAAAAEAQAAPIEAHETPVEPQAEEAPIPESAPALEENVHTTQPDLDHAADQPAAEAPPEAPQGDLDSQELMRQLREAIKERAEQAGRRRKRKDDFQEAASSPKSTQ